VKLHISKQTIVITLLLSIMIIGLILRLTFVYGEQIKFSADAKNYDIMVKQYLDKGFMGYQSDKPNARVTPGYPLFLSVIYKTFGYQNESPFTAVRFTQAILGMLSILLIYLIGSHTINRRVGLLAALLYAVYPPYLQSISLLLTEVLYTFFFLLYFWVQLKALKSMNKWLHLIAGCVFALAILTRPLIFPLLAVPFIYQWFVTKDRKLIISFLYSLAGMIVIMLPWWIRNYIDFHKIILLCNGGANALYAGAFPYMKGWVYVPAGQQFIAGVRAIINGFITTPIEYLSWFTLGKLNITFSNPWYDYNSYRSLLCLHSAILTLGTLGIIFSIFAKKLRLIVLYIILLTGMQLLFIPERRYAYPILPLFILLAAFIIDYIFIQSRKNSVVSE
jgi:4-amino-4-deoxy-L-arabinose transferase-like glycosyltransferase